MSLGMAVKIAASCMDSGSKHIFVRLKSELISNISSDYTFLCRAKSLICEFTYCHVKTMAKQDDQQIDPERLGPSSTGVDENLSFDTSQDPARPEFDARPGTATSEFLLEGTPPQIGPVRPPTENPSRAASSVGSTPDALTGNPLARRDASRKKRAFVAYFSRQSTHGVRMEYARPTVADIALSSEGIKEMEKQWNKNAEIPYSHPPHFRWIHLPANNLEWVEVCWSLQGHPICSHVQGAVYRILHNIVRKKDENWKKENKFANDVRDQILRREYWADQQNKGFPDVHHSRFMRPFCRQISDAPKSASKLAANQHLIFMVGGPQIKGIRKRVDKCRCHICTGKSLGCTKICVGR